MEQNNTFKPLKSDRFVINVVGAHIPHELFLGYKMYNQDKTIIVETKFYETEEHVFNPKEFFEIEDLLIQNLDEDGEIISTYDFNVKGVTFEKNCSPSVNRFIINKITFITSECKLIKNETDTEQIIHEDEDDEIDIDDIQD